MPPFTADSHSISTLPPLPNHLITLNR